MTCGSSAVGEPLQGQGKNQYIYLPLPIPLPSLTSSQSNVNPPRDFEHWRKNPALRTGNMVCVIAAWPLTLGAPRKDKSAMRLKLLWMLAMSISIAHIFTAMRMKLGRELKIGEVIARKSGSQVRY